MISKHHSQDSSEEAGAASLQCRFQGQYLNLLERRGWEFASRVSSPEVVAIIAVTSDQEILLVEQYREPVQGPVIELPAGLIGDEPGAEDEAALDAARRELLEETGYSAGRWSAWGRAPTSAGLSNEIVRFYHAEDLVRQHDGGGDDSEDITGHRIALDQAGAWLRDQAQLVDPKIQTALYWLAHPQSRPDQPAG